MHGLSANGARGRGRSCMKGSDKWGQRGGPGIRAELVIAGLLVLTAAGAYVYYLQTNQLTTEGQGTGITRITTTGIECGDPSMPLLAQQVENSTDFSNLAGGVCYNYNGENQSSRSTQALYFDAYNGTIDYPCGTASRLLVASEIVA